MRTRTRSKVPTVAIALLLAVAVPALSAAKPLVLQEMSWVDVQEYLAVNDMVIIPLGSTEQHGPHLPLGSDSFEALEMCRLISSRTGVVVAPVLLVGYSAYHAGFPGTISLEPETMEQVLFEAAATLIGSGFRRILFFNYHGGNNIVQDSVIHRINHATEAVALAIGHGSAIQTEVEREPFDWHAGKNETSIMLHLRPDLVRLDRAERPTIRLDPRTEELKRLAEKDPRLEHVWTSLVGVPAGTGKGGASHELSSNGIWSLSDPVSATAEIGQEEVGRMVEAAVGLIEAWKQAEAVAAPGELP